MMLLNSYSSYNPNLNDDMAFKKRPEKIASNTYHRSKSLYHLDSSEFEKSKLLDEIDDPHAEKSSSGGVLFETMKHEMNRLNSFTGKWPLTYVKPSNLAENGFFYLQSEDKVQCAFCKVILDDWNVGQKPLREHIRKSPLCPFMRSKNVGNVPINQQSPVSTVSMVGSASQVNSSVVRPKHPRMAGLKTRLDTYKNWPHITLSTKQLAECGLYYTGVEDHVVCFFCGGSIGNWELNDDPWIEHTKFFPKCPYITLVKRHSGGVQRQLSAPISQSQVLPCPDIHQSGPNLSTSLHNAIITEACNIFSKPLVEAVVMKHLKESSRHFTSLNELCEAVLEYSERENSPSFSQDVTGHTNVDQNKCEPNIDVVCSEPGNVTGACSITSIEECQTNNTKTNKDIFLCKICMDQQMSIAFQPCGHVVACPKCAQLIFTCPLCRSPVTSKVKIYLS